MDIHLTLSPRLLIKLPAILHIKDRAVRISLFMPLGIRVNTTKRILIEIIKPARGSRLLSLIFANIRTIKPTNSIFGNTPLIIPAILLNHLSLPDVSDRSGEPQSAQKRAEDGLR